MTDRCDTVKPNGYRCRGTRAPGKRFCVTHYRQLLQGPLVEADPGAASNVFCPRDWLCGRTCYEPGDPTFQVDAQGQVRTHHGVNLADDCQGEDRYGRAERARRERAHRRRQRLGRRTHLPLAVRGDVLSAGRCAWCGATEALSVDHIVPWSQGGTHERSNLRCLCLPCNVRRGAARIPEPQEAAA